MNRIIDLIIGKYKLVLIAILIISIPFGYFYANQSIKNHIDIYFEKDDPDLLFYKKFQKQYGNEEMGIIVFKDKDIFTKENIDIIRKISNLANRTKGVQKVISLSEATISKSDKDTLIYERAIPEGELTNDILKESKEKVLNNEIFKQSIISEDGTTTAIMIELKPAHSYEKKRKLIKHIMVESRKIAGDKVDLHFTGSPYIEVEINHLTSWDNKRFTPIAVLLIISIVALLLKKLLLSFLALFNILLTIVWGLGMLTLCGEHMNMVTVIISPVLLAIAVASSIHILSHYRELHLVKGLSHKDSIAKSLKALWLPCLFTSITTAIGFLSFITATVRPAKIMGIFTAIGVMFAFILTITFLPVILIVLRKWLDKSIGKISNSSQSTADSSKSTSPAKYADSATLTGADKSSEPEGLFIRLLLKIGKFTLKNYIPVSIVSTIIIITAVIGMFKLRYETNFANYLLETNTIKQDINFVEKNMGGSIPIVVLIKAKSKDHDFTQPESLKLLEKVQKETMEFMGGRYTWSFSIVDYFKELNQAMKSGTKKDFVIPDNRIDILDYYDLGDANDIARIVSPDQMEARISYIARLASSSKMRKFHDRLELKIKNMLGDNYTYNPTGSGPLYGNLEKRLKESQIRSFSTALICIFIMMLLLCRNLKLTLISMIPNVFPIVLTLGLMGWYGVPLDVSTIMIASITIGIAVDDTIHFLTWFRRNRVAGLETKAALLKTYKDTGKPITITSVVLFCSYFVLITGSIVPTITFGILAGCAMLFALLGDLFILPAVILIFKPKIMSIVDKQELKEVHGG